MASTTKNAEVYSYIFYGNTQPIWKVTIPYKKKPVIIEWDHYTTAHSVKAEIIKFLSKQDEKDRKPIPFYRDGKKVGKLYWKYDPLAGNVYLYEDKNRIEVLNWKGEWKRLIDKKGRL